MRRRLARSGSAQELEARKRRLAVMTYDDLLTRLDAALGRRRRRRGRRAAARALRRRARRRVPGHRSGAVGHHAPRVRRGRARTLVLIADPKQAIYAFRGADVYAYLDAARGRRHAGDARRQLAQRPGADRRLRRAVRGRQARARGDRLSPASAPPTPTASRACTAHRATRRCAFGCVRARPSVEPDPQRASRRSSSAREHIAARPGRRRRRAAVLGRRGRDRSGDGDGRVASASARRTSRCWCGPTATAALIREALERGRRPGRDQRRRAACSPPTPAREWLRLLEALERPASIARAHSAALTALSRLVAPSGSRKADETGWEERPPSAARLGEGAARARRRVAARDDHA